METKERIVFLDYVRVLACFMVFVVHSCENYYLGANHFGVSNQTDRWIVSVIDGICRISVPLFLMVSAYLLAPLKEGTDEKAFLWKRTKRIIVPLLLMEVIYIFLPLAWGDGSLQMSFKQFLKLPLNFPMNAGHLWFVYALFGLYLFLPIISPWLRKATAKQELYFIVIWLVASAIPFLNHFWGNVWGDCGWNRFGMLYYFNGYLGYVVAGHYIKEHLDWSDRKRRLIGAALFIIGATVAVWTFYAQAIPGEMLPHTLEIGWDFATLNIVLASLGAFLIFTTIHRGGKVYPIIVDISKASYGMYLMHMLFLTAFSKLCVDRIPTALSIFTISIATFASTYIVTRLVSFIPGGKWIVGYDGRRKKEFDKNERYEKNRT